MDVQITGLYQYPIKSCAGIALDSCQITQRGIVGDREWMLVNEKGQFVSQRKYPRMAFIHVQKSNGSWHLTFNSATPPLPNLELIAPDNHAPVKTVHLWKDRVQALLADRSASTWITQALQSPAPLSLVYFDKRQLRHPGQPQRFGSDTPYFADAAPFLLANALSLHTLNVSLRLKALPEVDIRHFRPNIVFSGLPGFAEHHVKALRHTASGLTFSLIDACRRCSIITVNPDTAERLPKATPFRQLAAINPTPHNPKAPAFGVNACAQLGGRSSAELKVGDRLEVIL